MNINEIMQRIDLPLLKQQKQWIVGKAWSEEAGHIIWGLVHLLDELQDALEAEA
tara:strand:- start:167 stop:328 length:162 start_codon:yes stop_codon:yes gene_type:complete